MMFGSRWIGLTAALTIGSATLLTSGAANAELRRVGTTSVYLDLDERFVEAAGFPGYEVPQSALVQAFEFPDFMLDQSREQFVDDLKRDWPNAKITTESLQVGGRDYMLATLDKTEDGVPSRTWHVLGGPDPTIRFHFMQFTITGTIPVFNKDTVVRLLSTASYDVPTFEERLATEGLSMTPQQPFQHYSAMRVGDSFVAAISTSPEVENALGIGLFLERVQPLPSLEDAARDKLGRVDWAEAEQRPATFAGQAGQRRSATYEDTDGGQVRIIQYVTLLGDQVLTLVAEGRPDEFDADIAAIVDEIAASVSTTGNANSGGTDASKGIDK